MTARTRCKNPEHDIRVFPNGKTVCRTCIARFSGEKGASALDNLPTLAVAREEALKGGGWPAGKPIPLGDPAEMGIHKRTWIYRLWGAKDVCLYVGQTTSIHPAVRVQQHQKQLWWKHVVRADYFEVLDPRDLDRAETQEIRKCNPAFNVRNVL
jgi:hypothetical protein